MYTEILRRRRFIVYKGSEITAKRLTPKRPLANDNKAEHGTLFIDSAFSLCNPDTLSSIYILREFAWESETEGGNSVNCEKSGRKVIGAQSQR